MGFDLIGLQPKNEKGKCFRNNIWWWRRLWWFTSYICIDVLNEDDFWGGCHNLGYTIRKEKAVAMAERLETVLMEKKKYEGLVKQSGEFFSEMQNNIDNAFGKELNIKCSYPFDWENVNEFYEFIRNSGGFQIY